ncbi:Spy/CpxP family protein refolding chaperone [Paucibacter sp. Y2R2-4]|uniref:Spy/CpxP family protein refolding chaperone n=1 Tax=Paucibacter sp. Y2R2-4 TaxID=2893553 RepID=UPI0021E4ED42|nr:Spy/CpxP family protein refolding chaperone [Paucibacter sp. Y2R2-4]MCV2352156.1 Spy/CpxP family protein refolding chaperone [Paucibacter sp. Y2R2-4]
MNKFSFANLGKKCAVVAAIAVVAVSAQAMGPGGPMEPGGHRGGPDMMMGRSMEHMLDNVDASDAQRAQVKQIMQAAMNDLKPQRESGRKLHMQMMDLLSAPMIDAGAVENLRQQVQSQQELSSKRMSQAMVDAARVLTPEQRAKLAERMKKMQARMAEHRGGKPGGQ